MVVGLGLPSAHHIRCRFAKLAQLIVCHLLKTFAKLVYIERRQITESELSRYYKRAFKNAVELFVVGLSHRMGLQAGVES